MLSFVIKEIIGWFYLMIGWWGNNRIVLNEAIDTWGKKELSEQEVGSLSKRTWRTNMWIEVPQTTERLDAWSSSVVHCSSSEMEGNDKGVFRRSWAINLQIHSGKTEIISLTMYMIRNSTWGCLLSSIFELCVMCSSHLNRR